MRSPPHRRNTHKKKVQTMNKEKKSAGYFDKNRQKPIFTGDIYKEEGAMLPYHRVEEKIDKSGFSIWHVGTNDRFDFSANAKNLIKNEYIGNVYDDKIASLKDDLEEYTSQQHLDLIHNK